MKLSTVMEEFELREALDVVWGMLTSQQINELAEISPKVIAICKNNHEQMDHE